MNLFQQLAQGFGLAILVVIVVWILCMIANVLEQREIDEVIKAERDKHGIDGQ